MKTVEVNISDIRENPNNPRLIKDDKFKKLVQSIKDFPQMLTIRPIVINADMTVLGGNMRQKAGSTTLSLYNMTTNSDIQKKAMTV